MSNKNPRGAGRPKGALNKPKLNKPSQSQQAHLKQKKGTWLYRFHNDSNEINEPIVYGSVAFVILIILVLADIFINTYALPEFLANGFLSLIGAAAGFGAGKSVTTEYFRKTSG